MARCYNVLQHYTSQLNVLLLSFSIMKHAYFADSSMFLQWNVSVIYGSFYFQSQKSYGITNWELLPSSKYVGYCFLIIHYSGARLPASEQDNTQRHQGTKRTANGWGQHKARYWLHNLCEGNNFREGTSMFGNFTHWPWPDDEFLLGAFQCWLIACYFDNKYAPTFFCC